MKLRLAVGVKPGRRVLALLLAAGIGFLGSGAALSPVAMITILAVLFIAVFLVALAISMLTEPSPLDPEQEAGTEQSYAEAGVQREAAYGS